MFRLRSALATVLPICLALLLPLAAAAQPPSGDVVISTSTAWPASTYSLNSLTVMNGAVLTIGGGASVRVANAITVTAQSSIVLQSVNNSAQVNVAGRAPG